MPASLSLTEGTVVPRSAELERLLEALAVTRLGSHVVALPGSAPPAAPLSWAEDGWVVGPYAGELALDGVRVELRPHVGHAAIEPWVRAAAGIGGWQPDDQEHRTPGIAPLVAMIWARSVDGATRHGPPALRREISQIGGSVRGRLDVRRTVRQRARGDTTVASLWRTRELDNPVTRIIVAADRVLARQVGHGRWRTERVEAVLPQLHSAVGRRAPIPGAGELQRIRYTPITRPFKSAAELSSRIVRQDPVVSTPQPGRVQGLVIDLAAVRTAAVLGWARAARRDLQVELADRGRILVRDRAGVRARVTVDGDPGREQLVIEPAGGHDPSRVPLPAVAEDAAATVRSALALL